MDLKILKTDNRNADFIELTKILDLALQERNGESQNEYDQHNKMDHTIDAVVIYTGNMPLACGAFKQFDFNTVEIKRVFVKSEFRGQGISKMLISQLEEMIKEQGYKFAVLETGIKQHEAISLYMRMDYEITANYEPYVGMIESVCMKKSF
ncbi:GNAT family N-acetyltransferase [Fusibacter sp. 3D3]|uniref:GNAT family N-acetyltransferase n=1 Tax=Fusibacter sp. 3D3 TaxID=1048380 RepID=UPI00085324D5|nr:GNAT family N-acetyltransferase [Fusibacter sp. 3D3]GAU76250.1 histone acetyltransferase HPA2 and related acetyltransferases [Fusibacter sp. 3D3]